jgi:hypothetical protein
MSSSQRKFLSSGTHVYLTQITPHAGERENPPDPSDLFRVGTVTDSFSILSREDGSDELLTSQPVKPTDRVITYYTVKLFGLGRAFIAAANELAAIRDEW